MLKITALEPGTVYNPPEIWAEDFERYTYSREFLEALLADLTEYGETKGALIVVKKIIKVGQRRRKVHVMTEQFKELCGAVDWDAVPTPVSFDNWLADFVPDKRLRDKMDDGRIGHTRARFEIIAERNGVELATVMWAILARCMGFGIFASNGVPVIVQDTDIESFSEKINGYLYRPDFLRFLIGCYADTPEHAQAHAQQIIILQERIAELDGNERKRFEL